MSDIDIADLRAKLAVATETPLAVWADLDYQGFKTVGDEASYQEILARGEAEESNPVAHVYTSEDAELIVSAVNALPALLDEIERLWAVTDEQVEAARASLEDHLLQYIGTATARAALEAARQVESR